MKNLNNDLGKDRTSIPDELSIYRDGTRHRGDSFCEMHSQNPSLRTMSTNRNDLYKSRVLDQSLVNLFSKTELLLPLSTARHTWKRVYQRLVTTNGIYYSNKPNKLAHALLRIIPLSSWMTTC